MKMERALIGIICTPLLVVSAALAQKADTPAPAQSARVCTNENGVQVCRNVVPAPVKVVQVAATPKPPAGKLLFLLDIPGNIFARLSENPERNREFHPRNDWTYQPAAQAPSGTATYNRDRAPGPAAWQYHPTTSFAYQPKQDWSYDRDVFSRIWRSNIQNDTRVMEVPTPTPGVFLIPVQEPR